MMSSWPAIRQVIPPRLAPLLLALAVPLALGGCESLIKDIIGVPEGDAYASPDASFFDGDVNLPDTLSLLNIKPDHGPFIGGTKVVITGSGFIKGTVVRVGGKRVSDKDLQLLSPVAMEIKTPAGKVGLADIEVSTEDAKASLPDAFRYDPVYLDPATGPTVGGTLVTIHSSGLKLTSQHTFKLGGKPLSDVEVKSSSTVQGRTPASTQGDADLLISGGAGSDIKVADAFTYYQSTNPLSGGLGGGAIKGTLTVSVLNWLTRAPIPGAKVVLQRGRQLELRAVTDKKGIAVFKSKQLTGPVTVTAGAPKHETSTIVRFDARDATIFLYPIIPPKPGGLPPGLYVPVISGNVLFGGTTGAGTAEWKIVPPPKKGQSKRVYVFSTNSSIRTQGPPTARSSATIDFDASKGLTAWPYQLYTGLGTQAIWAVAGLYNKSADTFEPYALGITRGVVTAAGDQLRVDVVIDIPLTEKVTVELEDVPTQVDSYRARLGIDLGADGIIMLSPYEKKGSSVVKKLSFGRLPKFSHPALVDGSYAVDVVLEASSPSELPLVRATETLIKPNKSAIKIDGFIGVPQQLQPAAGATLQGNTLRWSSDGATPDLAVTLLEQTDETPVWRIISPGHVREVSLPDPETFGLVSWPSGTLNWFQWLAKLQSFDFDKFDYSLLGSGRWTRYSYDKFQFKVKP